MNDVVFLCLKKAMPLGQKLNQIVLESISFILTSHSLIWKVVS